MTRKEVTQLSYDVVGCAISVHKELGPGLLESVYQKCLEEELESNGFYVEKQLKVPIIFNKKQLETELKLDILVNNTIIVEIKTVENLLPVHEAQLLTYMKLLKKPQGLLINFYVDVLKNGVKPFVNEYFKSLVP